MTAQIPVLIFLVTFLPALLPPVAGRMKSSLSNHIASASLFAAALLGLAGLMAVTPEKPLYYSFGGWQAPFGIEWRFDTLSGLIVLLITALACLVTASTHTSVSREIGEARGTYQMSILLLMAGLIGMTLTNDLFNLFVFLEVSSLAAYALIAAGNSRRGSYASLRYLFIASIGASFYLLGVGYLYAATGTLNMTDILTRLPELSPLPRSVQTGTLLIFLGLAIKMGLFPFHGWLPDAYTHSSNPVTSLIAPIMTKVAIYALIRISFWVLGTPLLDALNVLTLLKWLGIAGVITGSLMAFVQTNVKRILAYSSIAHLGLIAIGIGLQNATALTGSLLHMINHAVMKTCLFLIVTSFFSAYAVVTVADLKRVHGRMPWTAAFFAMAALSMIGIPPFSGFFSKWYLVSGAIKAQDFFTAGLVVFSGLLSALYFFRLMEKLFFKTSAHEKQPDTPRPSSRHPFAGLLEEEPKPRLPEGPPLLLFCIGLLATLTLLLGFAAPWLYDWLSLSVFEGISP